MVKFTMSLSEAMEEERQGRKLDTPQKTIRSILADYFRQQSEFESKT